MFDRNTEMDMTEGPLFKKLVAYAIPIMLTGILQLLFNAADLIVVGRFAGRTALAAVGSTTSLTNLLVKVFMMISIGVSVAVAQHYGAHEPDEVERTVSTAMLMSVLLGAAVCLIGMAACKPMLKAMGSPDDVIDQSVLYMRIYFTGMPAFMVYNFGASALRAVGDNQAAHAVFDHSGHNKRDTQCHNGAVFQSGRGGRRHSHVRFAVCIRHIRCD